MTFGGGYGRSRLGGRGLLGGGLGTLVFIVIVAYQIIRAIAPSPPAAPCPAGQPCGAPPQGEQLVSEQVFRSADLGFEFSYDPRTWSISSQDARGAILETTEPGRPFWLWISAVPAGQASPSALLAGRVGGVGKGVIGLARDTNPGDEILGPALGYVPGVGARYAGQVDTPQGPGGAVTVAILASTDGRITAVASVVTDAGAMRQALQRTDSVLNTFRWPALGA